jgi:uncharacterized membrane protein YdjX (TVP38/TMEM64 family)
MSDPVAVRKPLWQRLWPLGLIALVFAGAWQLGVFEYLSLDTLRARRAELAAFVSEHYWLALGGFILFYTIATASMFPAALWITIAGGFLFGLTMGSVATQIGATLGASLLFLAARTSFGEGLRKLAGGHAERVRAEFLANPLAYMFAMRFLPVLPFAVANIVPALLGAKFRDYVLTTFLGIIPGVVAYTWIGAGLSETFARGEDPDVQSVFRSMLGPSLALMAVSLLPVIIKRFRSSKAA